MANTINVTPNLWVLSGSGIHVRYSTIAWPGPAGGPHLIYQGATTLSFSGNQIRSVDVADLGVIVSVTLQLTVDAGSTTFSVLLPQTTLVQQSPSSSVPVTTEGITTHHAGPLLPPAQGQHEFYTVTRLTGSASHVLAL
jgi:hypothetical protein